MIAGFLLLAGCAPDRPAEFFTNADVELRSGQGEEATVVAMLPRGTPVVPAGWVGSECRSCWKVETPQGKGWVYTRFLDLHLGDLEP